MGIIANMQIKCKYWLVTCSVILGINHSKSPAYAVDIINLHQRNKSHTKIPNELGNYKFYHVQFRRPRLSSGTKIIMNESLLL